MSKNTQLASFPNSIYRDSNGNVGIGISTPTETLTVAGSARFSGQAANFSTGSKGVNIDVISASGLSRIYAVTGTGTAGDLAFGTNNTEVLRITASGYVGIGTTGAIYPLHIAASYSKTTTSGSAQMLISTNEAAVNNPFALRFQVFGGASLANRYATLQTTDYNSADGGNIALQVGGGDVGIGTTSPVLTATNRKTLDISGVSQSLLVLSTGSTWKSYLYNDGTNLSIANNSGYINFDVAGERMRILNNGQVFVGTSTAYDGYTRWSYNYSSNAYFDIVSSGADAVLRIIGSNYGQVINKTGSLYITCNDGAGHMIFRTSSGGITERMRITAGGYVGIGVTNPTNALQVQGNVYSTDTVIGRNIQPYAFAGPVAGSPTGAGIPVGYSSINISTPCDGAWRPIMTNINDTKAYFWVTLGDAASKDTGHWFMSMTSPAYGVYNFGNVSYQDNGWNTGGFDFSYDSSGGTFRLLVRCTSYYNSGNTAYGTIYFLRLE